MDHKLNIKFGEINSLSDARYAAGMGAAFMGFNLSTSNPKSISLEKLKEISGWAPGPAIVTEWENEPADVIANTCNKLDIEYVQLNAFNPAVTAALKPEFCVIQNIDLNTSSHIGELINKVSEVNGLVMYYMLTFNNIEDQDFFLAKSGNALFITDLCRDQPVILNFQFNKSNILTLMEQFNPFGININGGAEAKPGTQDYNDLNHMFDLLGKTSE